MKILIVGNLNKVILFLWIGIECVRERCTVDGILIYFVVIRELSFVLSFLECCGYCLKRWLRCPLGGKHGNSLLWIALPFACCEHWRKINNLMSRGEEFLWLSWSSSSWLLIERSYRLGTTSTISVVDTIDSLPLQLWWGSPLFPITCYNIRKNARYLHTSFSLDYFCRFISFCRVGAGLSDGELDAVATKLKPYFRYFLDNLMLAKYVWSTVSSVTMYNELDELPSKQVLVVRHAFLTTLLVVFDLKLFLLMISCLVFVQLCPILLFDIWCLRKVTLRW